MYEVLLAFKYVMFSNIYLCFYNMKELITTIVTIISGKIIANQMVDFEQVQWLNFTIRARDHGSPPRIAELPVFLRIVDVNDNNPVFLQPSYQVLIKVYRYSLLQKLILCDKFESLSFPVSMRLHKNFKRCSVRRTSPTRSPHI